MKKQKNGITLIALIITIVIMLILAGVTINIAIDGGLFGQTSEAVQKTEIAQIREKIQAAIIAKRMENRLKTGKRDLSQEDLEAILKKEGTIIYGEDGTTIKELEPEGRNYRVPINELWTGTLASSGEEDGDISEPSNDVFGPKLKSGMTPIVYSRVVLAECKRSRNK
jgi:type II secretory pathway pseudopilin PulG